MAKKYLDDNGLLYFWGKLKLTFALISHTHTKSQITDFPTTMPPTSHTHGNITNAGALQSTDITIATGDKIVVTDGSNSSKVARTSLAFDTATEGTDKKALTQAGTWQTFLTAADVPEGASASTTTPKALGADNQPDGYVGTETSFARGDHVHPLIPVFTGATTSESGKAGLVPAPAQIQTGEFANHKFLSANGSFVDASSNFQIINGVLSYWSFGETVSQSLPEASATNNGLMSIADKSKLDGIESGAEENVLEGVQINSTDLTIQANKKVNIPLASSTENGVIKIEAAGDPGRPSVRIACGYTPSYATATDIIVPLVRTQGDGTISAQFLPEASTTVKGAMSSADKTKLDSITMTNGVIDSSVLPSFVDDVIEAYARTNQTELGSTWLATGSATGTVITPEAGKIYVLMNSSTNYEQNTQFRWGGTAYVQLNDSGCTSITNAEIDTIVAS